MELKIGGFHTDIERKKLLEDMRRQLAPLIASLNWNPRSDDRLVERSVVVRGAPAEGFSELKEKIDRALGLNGRGSYFVEREEDLAAHAARKKVPELSTQFHYVKGPSEDAAEIVFGK